MHLLLCGHGYLGQAIARDHLALGGTLTALSRTGGDGSLACDVSSAEAVADLARRIAPPDAIVHCASSGRGGTDTYRGVFVEGCRNLVENFPGIPLLFTSSSSVYAQTDGSTVTEESPAEPDRETGRLLLEAEAIVLRHGGIVARLSGIYGPHRSVILRKFLSGEAVIEEDGRRFLNQIHRDDASAAIRHLLSSGALASGEIFNVTDTTPLSQLECHVALAGIFALPMPPSGPRDPERKRGWTHKRVSNAKLLSTGWTPRYRSFLDAANEVASTLGV